MRQEWKRLMQVVGCGVVLCGGVVLAEDAAPVAAPAAPAPAAPGRREMSPEMKELRATIEAKEKAILEQNAELKKEADALEAQAKAKRDEGTNDARQQSREISRQRQEKLAAADPELKELYAKQSELMRAQWGGRGGGQNAPKPDAKPANP